MSAKKPSSLNLTINEKEILIIGTGHVLKESITTVRRAIGHFHPQIIAVELDMGRFIAKSLKLKPNYGKIKATRAEKLFFLILYKFQEMAGKTMGMEPGEDMFSAIKFARKHRIPVILIDRDIRVTLNQAKAKITRKEKLLLLKALFFGFFEIRDKEKISSVLDNKLTLMAEFKEQFPTLYTVLVEERDKHMAQIIFNLPQKRIAVIVGAGHMEGIETHLHNLANKSKIKRK